MTRHDNLRDQLLLIENLLRQHEHWQETAPHESAFAVAGSTVMKKWW